MLEAIRIGVASVTMGPGLSMRRRYSRSTRSRWRVAASLPRCCWSASKVSERSGVLRSAVKRSTNAIGGERRPAPEIGGPDEGENTCAGGAVGGARGPVPEGGGVDGTADWTALTHPLATSSRTAARSLSCTTAAGAARVPARTCSRISLTRVNFASSNWAMWRINISVLTRSCSDTPKRVSVFSTACLSSGKIGIGWMCCWMSLPDQCSGCLRVRVK